MINHITAAELRLLLEQNPPFLLDVREPHEHEAFHIGGLLIPLAEVLHRAAEIPRDQPVIVYCRKGIRSQIAIQKLEEKYGFNNLINLRGGVEGLGL
jgi:adenylyltransferase/sulfurtransferase